MQYLFYIVLIPFLYLNYKIIISDIKYKIIPNKYLWYLLLLIPFWYLYIFLVPVPWIEIWLTGTGTLIFIWQIFLTFIISFILYSFWIWSAWDAKYLLVLSLFIPYIWIIPFIWNIALLTISYLLLYFIWFYFGKCIFYKWYAKNLFRDIKIDLGDKWLNYKNNKSPHLTSPKGRGITSFFIILKWLVIFLIIFVSIRLARIYLFNELFTWETSQIELLSWIIKTYSFYLIFWLIILFIWWLYIFRLFINKLKNIISWKLWVNITIIWNIFIIILFLWLIYFIYIQYLINSNEIIKSLFRIFSLYLGIYTFAKIMIYSYKITFWIAECEYIDIKELKEWDIVDKEYLRKILSSKNPKNKVSINNYNYNIQYIKTLNNPINLNTILKLKSIFKKTNNIYLNDKIIKIWFNIITNIKILKTFSFAPYILVSLIITFIFQNYLIILIIKNIMLYLNNFEKY